MSAGLKCSLATGARSCNEGCNAADVTLGGGPRFPLAAFLPKSCHITACRFISQPTLPWCIVRSIISIAETHDSLLTLAFRRNFLFTLNLNLTVSNLDRILEFQETIYDTPNFLRDFNIERQEKKESCRWQNDLELCNINNKRCNYNAVE